MIVFSRWWTNVVGGRSWEERSFKGGRSRLGGRDSSRLLTFREDSSEVVVSFWGCDRADVCYSRRVSKIDQNNPDDSSLYDEVLIRDRWTPVFLKLEAGGKLYCPLEALSIAILNRWKKALEKPWFNLGDQRGGCWWWEPRRDLLNRKSQCDRVVERGFNTVSWFAVE